MRICHGCVFLLFRSLGNAEISGRGEITVKKLCKLIGEYFGVVIVLFFIGGLLHPSAFTWVLGKMADVSILNFMLGLIMFGMGTTMRFQDFFLILQRPKDVFMGALAQYTIMPLLAYALCSLFDLNQSLTVGIVLVATCPGGTASNVITFISKGDLPLSVTMTSISTLISPIMTPFLTYLLIGQRIEFSPAAMFWSIIQIVIIPIALGVIIRYCFPIVCQKGKTYLPALSCLCISLLIAGLTGGSRDAILSSSAAIMAVIILHNLLGSALGFAAGRAIGMNWKKCVALSVEVGMQNSGLAAGLAKTHFPLLTTATVPGALFSSWQNIAGSMMAWLYVNYLNPLFDKEYEEDKPFVSKDVVPTR